MTTVLIDCDGVMGRFDDMMLGVIKESTGIELTLEDIKGMWDFLDHPQLRNQKSKVWHHLTSTPGLFANMKEFKEAIVFVDTLREMGHKVIACTSLVEGYFASERTAWLLDRGFSRKEIFLGFQKEMINGDVLIDDKPANILRWAKAHPHSLAIYWQTPGRELPPMVEAPHNVMTVGDWQNVIAAVIEHSRLRMAAWRIAFPVLKRVLRF